MHCEDWTESIVADEDCIGGRREDRVVDCDFCHGTGEVWQRMDKEKCRRCVNGKVNALPLDMSGLTPQLTGQYFMDARPTPTAWDMESIVVKDIDALSKVLWEFDKPVVSEREQFLEEENKRLKVRVQAQRKELKRLNRIQRGYNTKERREWRKYYSFYPGRVVAHPAAKEDQVLVMDVPNAIEITNELHMDYPIDMMGVSCKGKYGCAGAYKETTQQDDWEGTLHCNWCNDKVKRYQ